MPTGKVTRVVRQTTRDLGFLSQEDGPDVYVRAEALPEGTTALKAGTAVEFRIPRAARVTRRPGEDPRPAGLGLAQPAHAKRKKLLPRWPPPIVEDLDPSCSDGVGEAYRHGRHPDRTAKAGRQPAARGR